MPGSFFLSHIAEDRNYEQFVEPELGLETDVAFQYPFYSGHHSCGCCDVYADFCIARFAPKYFNMADLIKCAFRFLKLFRVLSIQRYWLENFVVKKIINKCCCYYYYFSQLMMSAADRKFNFRSPFVTWENKLFPSFQQQTVSNAFWSILIILGRQFLVVVLFPNPNQISKIFSTWIFCTICQCSTDN